MTDLTIQYMTVSSSCFFHIVFTKWKMQDLYGRVGVVQIHPVFVELLHAFDTRPPIKSEVDLE